LLVFLSASGIVSAQTLGQKRGLDPATPPGQPGMRIGGDRDGPVGLFVAPWQEPADLLPDAPLQAALTGVVDGERSVADDPVNRELPSPAQQAAAKAVEAKPAAPPQRRGRGRKDDDVPTVNIMQHDKR
jgi:hypothetical protein